MGPSQKKARKVRPEEVKTGHARLDQVRQVEAMSNLDKSGLVGYARQGQANAYHISLSLARSGLTSSG